jgi:hypothetical protein
MGYMLTFTDETALSIPGAVHGLGTAGIFYQLYDSAVPAHAIMPGGFHVTPGSYDVLVTFNAPQSGTLFLLPVTADGIDSTPGASTASSYVSVTEATDLLQERLHVEAWYTADPEEAVTLPHRREAALMQATRLIDEQVTWYGAPTTSTQSLAWPQTGQVDRFGRPVDAVTVPVAIQRATAYYALALLEADEAMAASANTGGGDLVIKSKKIGDTQITYQDAGASSTRAVATPGAMPNEVKLLLKPYGIVPGFGMVPVLRT